MNQSIAMQVDYVLQNEMRELWSTFAYMWVKSWAWEVTLFKILSASEKNLPLHLKMTERKLNLETIGAIVNVKKKGIHIQMCQECIEEYSNHAGGDLAHNSDSKKGEKEGCSRLQGRVWLLPAHESVIKNLLWHSSLLVKSDPLYWIVERVQQL